MPDIFDLHFLFLLNIKLNIDNLFYPQESSHSHALKCQFCPQHFADVKSLQIHSYLEHHRPDSRPGHHTPPAALNLSHPRHPSPDTGHLPGHSGHPGHPVPCHICGIKLPNQATFQQVKLKYAYNKKVA